MDLMTESLRHTDWGHVLWGKQRRYGEMQSGCRILCYDKSLFYKTDLWHENTASVEAVMIHDHTHT